MSEITMLPCPHCGSNNCNVEIIKYTDATWRYYGYCYDCETCGPSVPESEGVGIAEVNAAEKWNALPRRLRWTREKPTQDGFYWWRLEEGCYQHLRKVVYVGYTKRWIVSMYNSDVFENLDDNEGEWAGPIPEPE